jgi:hypothetical protein
MPDNTPAPKLRWTEPTPSAWRAARGGEPRAVTAEEAERRLRADLETHDSGGLAYAAADCESIALVRADDLRAVLADRERLEGERGTIFSEAIEWRDKAQAAEARAARLEAENGRMRPALERSTSMLEGITQGYGAKRYADMREQCAANRLALTTQPEGEDQ